MKNFFHLANTDYDYEQNFFLEGPDVSQEEFYALCSSLMEESGLNAIKIAQQVPKEEYNQVQSREIMDELLKLLEPHGFKQFKPKEASFFGSHIGDMRCYERKYDHYSNDFDSIYPHLKTAHELICQHNQDKQDEEFRKS